MYTQQPTEGSSRKTKHSDDMLVAGYRGLNTSKIPTCKQDRLLLLVKTVGAKVKVAVPYGAQGGCSQGGRDMAVEESN